MSNGLRTMVILFVLLYVLSPVDAAPGPIDDAIVMLLGMSAFKDKEA